MPALVTVVLVVATNTEYGHSFLGNNDNASIYDDRGSVIRGTLCETQLSSNMEKRHKEAKLGRTFRTDRVSTIRRHYRLPGRGGGLPRTDGITGLPCRNINKPARRCAILQKFDNWNHNTVSHSGVRNKRTQRMNLFWKRIWWEEGDRQVGRGRRGGKWMNSVVACFVVLW